MITHLTETARVALVTDLIGGTPGITATRDTAGEAEVAVQTAVTAPAANVRLTRALTDVNVTLKVVVQDAIRIAVTVLREK